MAQVLHSQELAKKPFFLKKINLVKSLPFNANPHQGLGICTANVYSSKALDLLLCPRRPGWITKSSQLLAHSNVTAIALDVGQR